MAKKPSVVSMARGVMYGASFAGPGIIDIKTRMGFGEDFGTAALIVAKQYGGIHGGTGQFDWPTVQKMWTPIVLWTVADTIASKLGVWKRMGRLIGNFNLGG